MSSINTTQPVETMPTNALDLKDIHIPEQISNFPIAYGWWLLIVLVIAIVVVMLFKLRKNTKRNQVKKQALSHLKNNSSMLNNDIIALLKWSAMHYFSRAELAKLFGDSLKTFFILKLPAKHQQRFADLTEQAFLNQYHSHHNSHNLMPADNNLHQAAVLWLTQALPPKPLKTSMASASNNPSKGANL